MKPGLSIIVGEIGEVWLAIYNTLYRKMLGIANSPRLVVERFSER